MGCIDGKIEGLKKSVLLTRKQQEQMLVNCRLTKDCEFKNNSPLDPSCNSCIISICAMNNLEGFLKCVDKVVK